MLRLVPPLHPQTPSTSPKLSFTCKYSSSFLKPQIQIPKYPPSPSPFILFAQNGNNNDLTKQPNKKQEEEENPKGQPNGSINGGDSSSRNDRKSMFNFRLGDLLLDPDPDNIVAVGLTGLLTWASVQVLWQLLLISVAILLAALKYSFIAALLIFVLITLL